MKYVIDHDLHIHSQLSSCSRHPEQTTENILNYAKRNGFRHICLTDHFWDSKVDGASNWYKPQNYEHIALSQPLPQVEGIKFDFGCETELDKNKCLGISPSTMDNFSFIIAPASHLHMCGFTVGEEVASVKERARFYMERNHALLDMPLPFYKMGLAHFTTDLIARGCDGSRDEIISSISDIEFAELFERVAKSGMGVELNVVLEDVKNEVVLRPYRIAKKCGCKFYLGSDAHNPNGLEGAYARFVGITEALDLTEDDKLDFARGY